MSTRRLTSLIVLAAVTVMALSSLAMPAGRAQPSTLTLYSGRTEALIGPLLERFTRDTGIEVRARYGDSAELAATILEEGTNSPADVLFSQDAGALGALASRGLLATLPAETLQRVDTKFQARDGFWVGVSGRARVIVYNTDLLSPADLPDAVAGLADPRWQGAIGWAPTNASLQASVTAMRLLEGEEAARQWLAGIKANRPKVYANNAAVVQAVANGEVQVGLVNHYYLYGFLKDRGPSFSARNYHPRTGGAGAIVNVAGVGLLSTATSSAAAQRFVDYLLSADAQQYFADQTFEYPLVAGVEPHPDLLPLAQINHPDIDLANLADLEVTLRLMREVGVL
ncbi:MAG: iron ABC transporter substrate-binding protein [Chloroflexi bacterium]|nr:iron ABC transporter substrate-binding protein [Chloroflexota bacterium]